MNDFNGHLFRNVIITILLLLDLKQRTRIFCDFMTRDEARSSIFEWIEVLQS